jgi:hypothetical protein
MSWTASEIVVAGLIAIFFVAGFCLVDIMKWF